MWDSATAEQFDDVGWLDPSDASAQPPGTFTRPSQPGEETRAIRPDDGSAAGGAGQHANITDGHNNYSGMK